MLERYLDANSDKSEEDEEELVGFANGTEPSQHELCRSEQC